MAITITPTLTRTNTGTTLAADIAFTSPHTSGRAWTVYGPNNYQLSGSSTTTVNRTETGSAGDVHVWRIVASATNTSISETESTEKTLGISVPGNGVYVYKVVSGVGSWVPLNF